MKGGAYEDADIDEIRRALAVLFDQSQVVELRALEVRNGYRPQTMSGYFDDHESLAQRAAELSGDALGVYVSLQEIDPSLLARRMNRVAAVGTGDLTSDKNVLRYRWLPLDFDPVRVSGVSVSEEEHNLAIARARSARQWLGAEFGWQRSILADSGNGGHVLVPMPEMELIEAEALIKKCLKAVADEFDDERVHVDQAVFNRSRIWKLYGTKACKGDSLGARNGRPARPHRIARLLEVA